MYFTNEGVSESVMIQNLLNRSVY